MLKNLKGWFVTNKYLVMFVVLVTAGLVALYTYNLKNLIPNNNNLETPAVLGYSSIDSVITEISFAPLKVILAGVNFIAEDVVFSRLVLAVTVISAVTIFYLLVSKWHTRRIALFSTILFATASYSLHIGRFTNVEALYYLFIPLLILMATWLKSRKTVNRFLFIAPTLAFFLYLPGILSILLIFGFIFQRRIRLAWKFVDARVKVISISVATIILVPLIYSLIVKPNQIFEYLAIDRVLNSEFSDILNSFFSIFTGLFYSGIDQPEMWLYGTPIIEAGTVVLLFLGIYSYFKGQHTLRARFLPSLGLAIVVLFSTGSLVTFALILPLVYLFVANGLAFLLQTWFSVFPKNPAARNTAVIAIMILVSFISIYHLQRYFIAWPNADETISVLDPNSQ